MPVIECVIVKEYVNPSQNFLLPTELWFRGWPWSRRWGYVMDDRGDPAVRRRSRVKVYIIGDVSDAAADSSVNWPPASRLMKKRLRLLETDSGGISFNFGSREKGKGSDRYLII